MFYVYVLKSLKNGDLYIGYSSNLKNRFKSHTEGFVTTTKGYRPWELVYYEGCKEKTDATRREIELKKHQIKDNLRKQLKHSIGAMAKR